ncbi:ABC transporter ATP-binding protein [Pontivivens insulae]|uniref:Oligopeptide transport ATP-binding protein OppD n=1 Tax=Pontivivens insulae TaxID=1639689 RepID=A0A2R8ACT2_9RHOB|nr:ABC transporter ATP-binding protein [Pontivivens insulae]RED13965.1 peptide/nickel transport system ATP-binding protein/oligopeptide transport system ATP-binding protein [Pontivivens insulae]SPF30039.1 Oligopeptide transport ATP-binding protein OppD [Pontivivens insulae]
MRDTPQPLLDVTALKTVFHTRSGDVHAVNEVSFDIAPGELVGVVGESGSGKSVTMMSLMGLLPKSAEISGGEVLFQGRNVRGMDRNDLLAFRGRDVGVVFQDPMTSLNPVFNVGYQITDRLRKYMGLSRADARKRAAELLALVGIPDPEQRLRDYPHQFSGGMRQRVMIAIALACDPKLLIADEPTTALDVTIQAQILELVRELRQKLDMGIIWITHDLGVVAGIADRVLVMYGGQIVEQGPVAELFANPQHPYTRALLETLPSVTEERSERLRTIEGQPPSLNAAPSSCSFAPRCRHAFDRCLRENPTRIDVGPRHDAACWWDPATGGPRNV